jgi:hypothetical protein
LHLGYHPAMGLVTSSLHSWGWHYTWLSHYQIIFKQYSNHFWTIKLNCDVLFLQCPTKQT